MNAAMGAMLGFPLFRSTCILARPSSAPVVAFSRADAAQNGRNGVAAVSTRKVRTHSHNYREAEVQKEWWRATRR
jgi:hypothetical protein